MFKRTLKLIYSTLVIGISNLMFANPVFATGIQQLPGDISDPNKMKEEKEAAGNFVNMIYESVIFEVFNLICGIIIIISIGSFAFGAFKLSKANPKEREDAIKTMLISALCGALAAAFPMIFYIIKLILV